VAERLDHFMARANAAYYACHDPFADFTTAPEISQVFGELIGAWLTVAWQSLGCPQPVILAECGPGRGTLMADVLRTLACVAPALRSAVQLHLVETSPRLQEQQQALLPEARFHAKPEQLPVGPLLLIANEFLDALPIRQFVRRHDRWTERFVQHESLIEIPTDFPNQFPAFRQTSEGEIREISEPACAFAAWLGRRLTTQGGVALLLDYGPEHGGVGDSLQAIRNGRPGNPLCEPGEADLTAHVDFAAIAQAAQGAGAQVQGPAPQGRFLTSLGLFPRTHQLARTCAPGQAMALLDAASRLAEPQRMGRLFKVLALCHPALPPLPGFETHDDA
jgi:SAM-dependent MidA family methyltransferase